MLSVFLDLFYAPAQIKQTISLNAGAKIQFNVLIANLLMCLIENAFTNHTIMHLKFRFFKRASRLLFPGAEFTPLPPSIRLKPVVILKSSVQTLRMTVGGVQG